MRLIFCYSRHPKCHHGRHGGIGISCLNTAKALMQEGYQAEVWPISGGDELWKLLANQKGSPVTHVVVAAFFIPTNYFAKLAFHFPNIKFAINSHSNIGFLQAEPEAITKMRETIDLQTESRNIFAAGNSKHFVEAMRLNYGHCLHLPNLYFLHGHELMPNVTWDGGKLRLGCFGASRVQKNVSTAIQAGVAVGKMLKAETEIWINTGRDDNNGNVVYRSARAWTDNLPGVTLKELPWQNWAEFRRVVETMHCLIQPSYTETFSQVSADACAAGVPTVSGYAIDWLPPQWQANTDNALDIAHHVKAALLDPHSSDMGIRALRDQNDKSLVKWRKFLTHHFH